MIKPGSEGEGKNTQANSTYVYVYAIFIQLFARGGPRKGTNAAYYRAIVLPIGDRPYNKEGRGPPSETKLFRFRALSKSHSSRKAARATSLQQTGGFLERVDSAFSASDY
ncbi:hypothetical protein VNO78_07862 [Psophocarpus tetragonolobus]|uniref:Uncharacterized protein n=1 Tax=Psophocarpus tetragonolobus TaxID=3891 RepID=A0AAN9XSA5_PSOTE